MTDSFDQPEDFTADVAAESEEFAAESASPGLAIKNQYDEVFEVELDGWCFGLQHFPGEVHPAVVYRVVKELKPAIDEAIKSLYVFDPIDVAARISRAAKYKVEERDIAFCILAILPTPTELNEDEQTVLLAIADKIDQEFGGALEKLQNKWQKKTGSTVSFIDDVEQDADDDWITATDVAEEHNSEEFHDDPAATTAESFDSDLDTTEHQEEEHQEEIIDDTQRSDVDSDVDKAA